MFDISRQIDIRIDHKGCLCLRQEGLGTLFLQEEDEIRALMDVLPKYAEEMRSRKIQFLEKTILDAQKDLAQLRRLTTASR